MRRLSVEVMELILKPCLLNVDIQTIAMGQQLICDPGDYYPWLYCNYAMLGLELRGLWASFGWRQKFLCYLRTFFISYIYPLPWVKWPCNRLLKLLLEKFTKQKSKKDT